MTSETVYYPSKRFAELRGVLDAIALRGGCSDDPSSKLKPSQDTTANSTWGMVRVGAEAARRMLGACIVSANHAVYAAGSSGDQTRPIRDVRSIIRAALMPPTTRREEPIAEFL